jgi:hypothetical protein
MSPPSLCCTKHARATGTHTSLTYTLGPQYGGYLYDFAKDEGLSKSLVDWVGTAFWIGVSVGRAIAVSTACHPLPVLSPPGSRICTMVCCSDSESHWPTGVLNSYVPVLCFLMIRTTLLPCTVHPTPCFLPMRSSRALAGPPMLGADRQPDCCTGCSSICGPHGRAVSFPKEPCGCQPKLPFC